MTTKVKALDRLIDAIAGSDVPVPAQTVAGTIDALADTLAGSDVTFTAQDIAGRLDELAKMVEDGTIVIGGGGIGGEDGSIPVHIVANSPATGELDYITAGRCVNNTYGMESVYYIATTALLKKHVFEFIDGTTTTLTGSYNDQVSVYGVKAYIYVFSQADLGNKSPSTLKSISASLS